MYHLINDQEYKPFLESDLKEFLKLKSFYDLETSKYYFKLVLELPIEFSLPLKELDTLSNIIPIEEKQIINYLKEKIRE